jgi:hypothetical protein
MADARCSARHAPARPPAPQQRPTATMAASAVLRGADGDRHARSRPGTPGPGTAASLTSASGSRCSRVDQAGDLEHPDTPGARAESKTFFDRGRPALGQIFPPPSRCQLGPPTEGRAASVTWTTRSKASTDWRRYGAEHRKRRRRWARLVDAGGVACARCGRLIDVGEPWHLDHLAHGSYPSHASCNVKAGAREAARVSNAGRDRRWRPRVAIARRDSPRSPDVDQRAWSRAWL